MEPYEIVSGGVKYVATGLLAILWWDVRKVRQMKDSIMGAVEKKYLTQDKHGDLCKLQIALMDNQVIKALQDMKTEIIKEIHKSNGV